MKNFKDLGITATSQAFTGDKIEMFSVLNAPIVVKDFKIEASKYPEKGNGKRLTLQIMLNEKEHIIFTGSVILMDMVQQVNKSDFPFQATIVKENKGFKFT